MGGCQGLGGEKGVTLWGVMTTRHRGGCTALGRTNATGLHTLKWGEGGDGERGGICNTFNETNKRLDDTFCYGCFATIRQKRYQKIGMEEFN